MAHRIIWGLSIWGWTIQRQFPKAHHRTQPPTELLLLLQSDPVDPEPHQDYQDLEATTFRGPPLLLLTSQPHSTCCPLGLGNGNLALCLWRLVDLVTILLGPLLKMPQKTKSAYLVLANRSRGRSRSASTSTWASDWPNANYPGLFSQGILGNMVFSFQMSEAQKVTPG